MCEMASQITSFTTVYSTVYSGANQRKHQSSASLAFVWGIHRGPVNSPHKGPVTRKMFPFDDVIMIWKRFSHYWPAVKRNPSLQRASNEELWYGFCYQPEQAVEQTIKLLVIWDVMVFMWILCHYDTSYIFSVAPKKLTRSSDTADWMGALPGPVTQLPLSAVAIPGIDLWDHYALILLDFNQKHFSNFSSIALFFWLTMPYFIHSRRCLGSFH